jgi:DNA polymerase-3 subunit epsilon/ATP-dependent DNA helicase DinG
LSAETDIIVALDLETTGLNPAHDAIIEIGAVRFQGDEVLDEWSSLVNPGRSVPSFITHLTGITQNEVDSAPGLRQVLPAVERFVGDAPVLGHNVGFDLGFLQRQRILASNEGIDTYEIASVMLPNASRYGLGPLAGLLGISLPATHRALDDARVTHAVYMQLWERALEMPLNTLAEIARNAGHVNWAGAPFFRAVMKIRSREAFVSPQTGTGESVPAPDLDNLWALLDAPPSSTSQLRPKPMPEPIDSDAVAALLEDGGRLATALPGYEHRPQQVEMLRIVSDALSTGQHLLIEAGTGVGKSLGYLLPAVQFAVKNDQRVIISTNTINLQEQLIQKDIPFLQETLGMAFRAAVLKGRSNYLCPRRLASLRRRGPTSRGQMRILAKVLMWLQNGGKGDRGEITLRGPAEQSVWRRLSAEDEGCTLDRCATQMGGACPFYQARRAAEAAHILVINHALLLADVATANRVLPQYRFLIVDEAHHLEDATTNGLSYRADSNTINRLLANVGTRNNGLLGDILARSRGVIPPEATAAMEDFVLLIEDAAGAMGAHVDTLFDVLRAFLEEHVRVARSNYSQQIRILEPLRRQPGWTQVEVAADNLSKFTSGIAEAMGRLAGGLGDLENYDIPEYEDLVASTAAAARHLDALHSHLYQAIFEPNPNVIYWVEIQPDSTRTALHAAPLDVGPMVEEHLWHTKDSIIMTSATLKTSDSFSFIQERLNADEADTMDLGSPFDYEASTLLYLVNDIPEPAAKDNYQRAVEKGLIQLCRATQGRALVLFTSHAQLRQTSNAISTALARDNIVVYDQSDGSSRTQLLEDFRQSEKAVLLGTRSYWEGVDVPGEDLSVLVIVRLPFTVPSDPVFAARQELFESPFMEYAVPEAVLRFRQGFGRLIRRIDDRGVVAIFDRRIVSKQYGQAFLDALPQCTVQNGPLDDLPRAAADWLEAE